MQVSLLILLAFGMLAVALGIRWKNAGGRIETTSGIRPSDGMSLWAKEKALDVLYCFTGTRSSQIRLGIAGVACLLLAVLWGGYALQKDVRQVLMYRRLLGSGVRIGATVREVYIHERRSRRSYSSWHTAEISYAFPNEAQVDTTIYLDAVEAGLVSDTIVVLVDPMDHASAYSAQYAAAHSGIGDAVAGFVTAWVVSIVLFLALGLPLAYSRVRRPAAATSRDLVSTPAGPFA